MGNRYLLYCLQVILLSLNRTQNSIRNILFVINDVICLMFYLHIFIHDLTLTIQTKWVNLINSQKIIQVRHLQIGIIKISHLKCCPDSSHLVSRLQKRKKEVPNYLSFKQMYIVQNINSKLVYITCDVKYISVTCIYHNVC